MHIDVTSSEIWEALGDELKTGFNGVLYPKDAAVQLRSYKSVGHAAFEASEILLQIYSHKRSLGYVKGLSPAFDFLIPQFLKEAFQIQSTDFQAIGAAAAWVEGLKKETNFVLAAEDHPITGEIFDLDELDKILNEKKFSAFAFRTPGIFTLPMKFGRLRRAYFRLGRTWP